MPYDEEGPAYGEARSTGGNSRMPAVRTARALSRKHCRNQSPSLSRLEILGQAGAQSWNAEREIDGDWACAGGAWRQQNWQGLYRGSIGRLAFSSTSSIRICESAAFHRFQ